jgi:hypothetical protein
MIRLREAGAGHENESKFWKNGSKNFNADDPAAAR